MADPERFDADPDLTFHADADPDPNVLARERKKFLQKLFCPKSCKTCHG